MIKVRKGQAPPPHSRSEFSARFRAECDPAFQAQQAALDRLEAREGLRAATAKQTDPATASRVLLICGAPRNDESRAGEVSKTYRLTKVAGETLSKACIETDPIDLSLITSDYRRHIHPGSTSPGTDLAAPAEMTKLRSSSCGLHRRRNMQ